MNTAGTADRSFAPTVPLLGAQGWIVAPAAESPRVGVVALVRQGCAATARATKSLSSMSICCATSG